MIMHEDMYLFHTQHKPPTLIFSHSIADETCSRVCAKGQAICIPSNYSKFDLPNETLTVVHVGIDIKDIPKIDDQEYRDVHLH